MAKSTKSSDTRKKRPNVDKIVKKVNKEFEKTSTQIEQLVDDAFKQLDSLQQQIQDPVRKLMKEIDELRDREMKRFHDELDRRLEEFQKIQDSVMDRLGIVQREAKRGEEAVTRSLAQGSPKAEKPAKKAASKTKSAASKPKTTASKTAKTATSAKSSKTGAKAAPAKTAKRSELTRIKGIGPVTASKLEDAGITTIKQIASPNKAEQEKINQFAKMKGFSSWPEEAKKLLG